MSVILPQHHEEDLLLKPKKIVYDSPKVSYVRKDVSYCVIPPSFLSGMTVWLNIEDAMTANQVSLSLENCGATIISKLPLMADYIVSEKPTTVSTIGIKKTRGYNLVQMSTFEQKTPTVILLKQIPWVFDYHFTKDTILEEELSISKEIVVAETGGRLRPIHKAVDPVKIYHGKTPNGYSISPFEPIPENIEFMMEKLNSHIHSKTVQSNNKNPLIGAYCEICRTQIKCPDQHHESEEHKRNIKEKEWKEFDELSEKINRLL